MPVAADRFAAFFLLAMQQTSHRSVALWRQVTVKKIITSSTSCFLALFRTGTHITTSNKNVKLNQYS
ncbi:hypothetical protein FWY28_16960 [Escherichia coli]|nr:hypothetical protein [Escherichia coli]